jgi:hypothetical protein
MIVPRIAAALVLALSLSLLGCRKEQVTDNDRAIFVRAQELAAYGLEIPDAARYEKFEKTRYFDGTYEVSYEFELPDDHPKALYMQITASVERTARDARVTQTAEEVGLNLGLKVEGIKTEEKNDFYRHGEKSNFFVLTKDSKPVGHFFVTRNGPRVYSILIAGIHFKDPADWADLLNSKLEKFAAYTP